MLEVSSIAKDSLIIKADLVRKKANKELATTSKSTLGQFMTPASTAAFMASLFPRPRGSRIDVFDPGAGVGSLSSAFLSRIVEWDNIKEIAADTFEIDRVMLEHLKQTLKECSLFCENKHVRLSYRIIEKDFILHASDLNFNRNGLWHEDLKRYSHCIMNPPYKKISSSSLHRKLLRSAGIETVNLYSGFVALALMMLEPGGQLVAIIPRSFCNGPYYRPFREYILENSAIRNIHLFGSRNKAFSDDKVLQENVIIRLEKEGKQRDVKLSFSTDDTFCDLTVATTPFSDIIHTSDTEKFIHIPEPATHKIVAVLDRIHCSLHDLGVQISTGPIVDFRLKDQLRQFPDSTCVPLLYPCHFSLMQTTWPIENSKKPNAICLNEETTKWLFPKGYYTVVRRFSSKEERRRIVASVVSPQSFGGNNLLGFENHLNIFHSEKKGLPEDLARGLAVFLNCMSVDEYFRRFSGHTQVNATDLRMMRYPDRAILMKLGKWSRQQKELDANVFDRKLEEFTDGPE